MTGRSLELYFIDGKPDVSVFTSDYAFGSASAAAAVVCGRPSNGTLEWKVQGQATTYKEWEANRLSDATQ